MGQDHILSTSCRSLGLKVIMSQSHFTRVNLMTSKLAYVEVTTIQGKRYFFFQEQTDTFLMMVTLRYMNDSVEITTKLT